MSTAAVIPPVEQPKPKFRREIQPKDDAGNAIGQPHVYEGETEQELMDKMADGIANGTKKINELSRKATLEPPNFNTPEGADPEEQIPEVKTRDLTADERFALANKFKDPASLVEAFDDLYEARFGVKPADAGKTTITTAKDARRARGIAEATAFITETSEYINIPSNNDVMDSYMAQRKMAPTKKNFKLAFKALSGDGLLTLKAKEPEVPAPAKEEVRTDPPTEPVQKTVIPRALTRSDASGSAPTKPKKPSAAEIALMNADQYKKYLASQA